MININTIIYEALQTCGASVVYAYPHGFQEIPVVSYYEIENTLSDVTFDGIEYMSRIAFQVDVWAESVEEIVPIARSIDDALFSVGMLREYAADIPGNDMLLHHKTMRYSCFVQHDGKIFLGRS